MWKEQIGVCRTEHNWTLLSMVVFWRKRKGHRHCTQFQRLWFIAHTRVSVPKRCETKNMYIKLHTSVICNKYIFRCHPVGILVDTGSCHLGYIQSRKRCKSVSSVYRCNPQVASNTGVQMDNNLYKSCNRRSHRYDLPSFTMDPQPRRKSTCTTTTTITMWLPVWLCSWAAPTFVQTVTNVITPKKNTLATTYVIIAERFMIKLKMIDG
jgi:hypothetical protein